jgi:hypothetical protein
MLTDIPIAEYAKEYVKYNAKYVYNMSILIILPYIDGNMQNMQNYMQNTQNMQT